MLIILGFNPSAWEVIGQLAGVASLSIMWGPGIVLGSTGLEANTFALDMNGV